MAEFDQKDQVVIILTGAIILILILVLGYTVSNSEQFQQTFNLKKESQNPSQIQKTNSNPYDYP